MMSADPALSILLLGTLDTKLEELLYLRSEIVKQSTGASPINVILLDVGRTASSSPEVDISQQDIISALQRAQPEHPSADLAHDDRGAVISYLATAATASIKENFTTKSIASDKRQIHGIIAAGGSGNTSLASQVMREAGLPIGFPKLIISTMASGETSHIVGVSDITLMPSVVDIAGLNSILRAVLSNAAGAITGMARTYAVRQSEEQKTGIQRQTRVGITMFGVTTPCVDHIRKFLAEQDPPLEAYVFHATGTGGRAMEAMVAAGELDAVLDVTTTEIADHLVGGVLSAGGARLEAALKAGIPCVMSVGACDMVNFGPVDSVPEKFKSRKLFKHNPSVTLMRTNEEECEAIGEFIVKKINEHANDRGRVQIWIPKGGVSALSYPGGAFEANEHDQALFDAIKNGLGKEAEAVMVMERPDGINDEHFAQSMVNALVEMLGK